MKKGLVVILLAVSALASHRADAATITAANNSNASVQSAVNSAVDGDEVVIPNGTVTWTGSVSVSGKGIHLRAASPGGLTVTHGAGGGSLLDLSTDASHHVEVSGIKFLAGSATGRFIDIDGSGKVPLLHDCTFEVPDFQLLNAVRILRRGGVIWNCTFSSNKADGSGSGCLQLLHTSGSSSWTTASTMGADDTTGTSNTYIEDCTFNNIINQCIDVDNNIRAVIRRSTFNNSQITVHGADTSSDGGRHTEIYDNTFVFSTSGSGANYPLPLNRFVYIRGGTGIITGNLIPNISSQTWGNKPEITVIMQNAQRSDGPYPCPQLSDYPVPHQIGQSHNGTSRVTDPLYMWGNTGTGMQGISLSDYGTDQCGNGLSTGDFVKSGRDYIVGTPKPGYTRYTYPHPARGGSGRPTPPQNFRIVTP